MHSPRQEFCVRWNSHLGSIGAAFPQLLAGQRFVDVTLACEGHQVHCHRLVLAACSSYFESLLSENPCKHPVIILPSEIKLWEIQALVDFMYKGEVNVTQAGLPQLLRCAEQLRIRGLYGSDAALNLDQIKSMTNKSAVAAAASVLGTATNDSIETDDTATNSTTSTTTATSVLQHSQHSGDMDRVAQFVKSEHPLQQTNGSIALQQQNHLIQQHLQQMNATNSNAPTEDESADDSTSNAYDNYEDNYTSNKAPHPQFDSTIEDEHNYVGGHDEDSFGTAADTEHETSANSSLLQASMDVSASFKRVRRSEASLALAAKCVSKGQTFQTVSNMYNIPVSTIRFYMARKGILPKRKRGRGASTSGAISSTISNTVMTQALAQMKRSISPTLEQGYHLANYKINEQSATNMI
ncbi:protein tramtrack, beta isoform [Teleopsis dalmanni]|uniref:protein tramtrack, beta isoform n=1 Tax=Teleopsis dalmanni TaxID=139649 RepID=UPI0018CFA2BA|nr:protein tramtrack, beta isoform [Teleopsis dalmanni]